MVAESAIETHVKLSRYWDEIEMKPALLFLYQILFLLLLQMSPDVEH